MAKTAIEWATDSWNPFRGCSRVSEGCRNCYAERTAARFSGPGQPYEGLVALGGSRPRWSGDVRFVPEKLGEPLSYRRPRRVFVNSMSDLFHESIVPWKIAAVFGVMAACPESDFLVLTKRPGRAIAFGRWIRTEGRHLSAHPVEVALSRAEEYLGRRLDPPGYLFEPDGWPPRNVLLGVSVEDDETARHRIPALLAAEAWTRWVSYEPALGPVEWRDEWFPGIDWVVVGGESGPGARPFEVDWAATTIREVRGRGGRVFVKQLGSRPMHRGVQIRQRSSKGGDPDEWPTDLRVREHPE